jgi:hypothetical protein
MQESHQMGAVVTVIDREYIFWNILQMRRHQTGWTCQL